MRAHPCACARAGVADARSSAACGRYATSAAVPGQHRSSELIDIFDDDKPCGNPCEQTKLQMNSRQQFYTSSCMRAIAVGDGMVSSGISSGTYLVRAKPIDEFVYKQVRHTHSRASHFPRQT